MQTHRNRYYRKTRLWQKQLPVMLSLRNQGMSMKQIADKYDITYGALQMALYKFSK